MPYKYTGNYNADGTPEMIWVGATEDAYNAGTAGNTAGLAQGFDPNATNPDGSYKYGSPGLAGYWGTGNFFDPNPETNPNYGRSYGAEARVASPTSPSSVRRAEEEAAKAKATAAIETESASAQSKRLAQDLTASIPRASEKKTKKWRWKV